MRPNDGRAVPTFLSQAMAGKPLTVFGDGSQTRSFCFVSDLIEGLVRLAFSGEHTPVNIGNPTELTLTGLAEAIVRVTGSKSEIIYEALPIDDPKIRRPDIAKARRLLHWEPAVDLEEGLRRTFEWEKTWRPHSLTGLTYEKPVIEALDADQREALWPGTPGAALAGDPGAAPDSS
jgi:dTDP-glucose 4,6-dehydratase